MPPGQAVGGNSRSGPGPLARLLAPCVLPMTWRRTETPTALADKVPMVAGALKSIEEVKKLARHPSSQATHHNNFFDSLTGQLYMRVCAIVQSAREVIAAMSF